MSRSIFLLTLILALQLVEARHLIVAGGPALRKWEELRPEKQQHDLWWANFIRASTIRIDELRDKYNSPYDITWIVYKPAYEKRSMEDGKPLTEWIEGQASKRNVTLVWVNSNAELLTAFNTHKSYSIKTFDYFGHSNKYCFMLDYGCHVMAASKAWLHESDLSKINPNLFSRTAFCKSYGCHTGESMSGYWKQHFNVPLIGAIGKTNYKQVGKGKMPSVKGSWTK